MIWFYLNFFVSNYQFDFSTNFFVAPAVLLEEIGYSCNCLRNLAGCSCMMYVWVLCFLTLAITSTPVWPAPCNWTFIVGRNMAWWLYAGLLLPNCSSDLKAICKASCLWQTMIPDSSTRFLPVSSRLNQGLCRSGALQEHSLARCCDIIQT